MTDHTDLIAKLKAATGPSDDLNADIADAIGWSRGMRREGHLFWHEHPSWAPRTGVIAPGYTSSLDAALGTARDAGEQGRMLQAAIIAAAYSLPDQGAVRETPPASLFHPCRAAMLVRLGGE